jgi:hypothetical protein
MVLIVTRLLQEVREKAPAVKTDMYNCDMEKFDSKRNEV